MTIEAHQKVQSRLSWQNPSWLHLLIALPWMIGIIWCLYGWRADAAISTRQQTIEGMITAHEPANHDRYGFTFSTGGRTYRGWEIPQKTEYTIGERVTVYYDPTDPSRSALTPFDELSLRAFGPVPLLAIGTGLVALFIYKRRKQLRVVADK